MAAKARDAQAGWGIYRSSGYSLSLEEINEKLETSGFNPVAPRTYQHYRKLHRYGYQRYVPINQLDVETLRDPVWGGPLQSRYRPRPAQLTVQLLVIVEDALAILNGDVTQLSDVEGTARVRLEGAILLSDPTVIEGSHALVVIGDQAKAVVIELVQPTPREPSVFTILFLFSGFIPTSELTEVAGLGPSHAIFTIATQEQGSPVVILRSLYSLFEAIDSARLVCDQVLESLGVADRFTFSPTRLNTLSLASPVIADVSLAAPPLLLLFSLVAYVEYLRRKHYEANVVRGQADILGEQARTLRIKNDRAELRSRLDVKDLVTYIVQVVTARLPTADQEEATELSPEALERVAELTEKQLLPDVETLLGAPTESVEIETDESIPPLFSEEGADDG
jgi:hypothetical protein